MVTTYQFELILSEEINLTTLSKNNELSAYDLRIKKVPHDLNLELTGVNNLYIKKGNQDHEKAQKENNLGNRMSTDKKLEIIKEIDIEVGETICQNKNEENAPQNKAHVTGSPELVQSTFKAKSYEEIKSDIKSTINKKQQNNEYDKNNSTFKISNNDHETKINEIHSLREGHLMRPPFNNSGYKELTTTQSIFI